MGNDYKVLYRLIHEIRHLMRYLPEICIDRSKGYGAKADESLFYTALTEHGKELYDTSSPDVTARYNKITIAVDYYERRFQIFVEPHDAQPGDDVIPLFITEITIPFGSMMEFHHTLNRTISGCSNGVLRGISNELAFSVTFNVDGSYGVNVDRSLFITRLLALLQPEIGRFKNKVAEEALAAIAITFLPLAHSGNMIMANTFHEIITSKPLTEDRAFIKGFLIDLSLIKFGEKSVNRGASYFHLTNHAFTESEKKTIKPGV